MRVVLFIALVLSCFALPRIAAAQPLPPAAPFEARTNGPFVRPPFERLRDLGGRLFDALRAPEDAGIAPGANLDPERLNGAFRELIAVAITRQPAIESLDVAFDPLTTDLSRDRGAVVIDAVLKRTAWSESPTHAHVELDARLEAGSSAPRIVVDGRLGLETDVLAMIEHLLPRVAARMERAAQREISAGAASGELPPLGRGPLRDALRARREAMAASPEDVAFQAWTAERLRAARVESMDDVADLIVEVSAHRFMAKVDEIERLRGELSDVGREAIDAATRVEIERRLDEARRERDELLAIRPRVDRDDQGRAVAVRLTAPSIAGRRLISAADVDVAIESGRVQLAGTVRFDDERNLLPIARTLAMGVLASIQNADAQARDLQRRMLEAYLDQGRELLFGDEP